MRLFLLIVGLLMVSVGCRDDRETQSPLPPPGPTLTERCHTVFADRPDLERICLENLLRPATMPAPTAPARSTAPAASAWPTSTNPSEALVYACAAEAKITPGDRMNPTNTAVFLACVDRKLQQGR